jgi:hypothetical protein
LSMLPQKSSGDKSSAKFQIKSIIFL